MAWIFMQLWFCFLFCFVCFYSDTGFYYWLGWYEFVNFGCCFSFRQKRRNLKHKDVMVNWVQLTFFVCSCVPVTDNFMVCVLGERERERERERECGWYWMKWFLLDMNIVYKYMFWTQQKNPAFINMCARMHVCVCMTTVSFCRQ